MTISLLYNGLDQNTFKFLLSTDNLNIKSFIPYTGCLLEHILHTNSLTNNEKLFYLIADSLSLINSKNSTKQRAVALSSTTWAEKLNCSKTEIFSLQKSLEEKGYFIIVRDKNKSGKNKRNVIIPTIPDNIFNSLAKELNRFNYSPEKMNNISYEHSYKRTYLDQTKLFIKLNYQILSFIVSSSKINSFAKLIWLDFYSKCYKNHIKSKNYTSNNLYSNDYFAFTCSYQELEKQYNCSKTLVSKTIKSLEELGFIKRNRFHVKNGDFDDNLHDKSLWNITVILPEEYNEKFIEQKADTNAVEQDDISIYDPYISNSDQLYNKNFISNNKDLDNIDVYQNFSDNSVNSSDLSVLLKNNDNLARSTLNSQVNHNHILTKSDRVLLTKISFINTNNNRLLSKQSSNLSKKEKHSKTLKEFYPLTKEQVDKLNSLSDREFSINFANQLLLKLYSRDTSKEFISKNHMMSYMSKAFTYEKHQAPLVNHESFRFVANLSEEDKREKDIEKYLTEVECSYDTSYSSQLQRKIVGTFEPKLAYQLLTKANFDYQQAKKEYDDNSCIISLLPNLELTNYQKEILENLIIAVYGFTNVSYKTRKYPGYKSSSFNSDVVEVKEPDPNSIWHKVRKELREELGENIDKNWFSKLTAKENQNKNVLNLYAPSPFYRDWINNKYSHRIRRCAQDIGVSFIVVDLVEPSVNVL